MNGILTVTSIPRGVRVVVSCPTLPSKLGIPLTIWKVASEITMEDLQEVIKDPELMTRVECFLKRLSRLKLPLDSLERVCVIMTRFGRFFGHPIVWPIRGSAPSEIPDALTNALILQMALQKKAIQSVLCRAKAVLNIPWEDGRRRQDPGKPYDDRIPCWYIEIIDNQNGLVPVEPTLGIIKSDPDHSQAFITTGYGYDLDGIVMVEGLPQGYAMDFSTVRMAPGVDGIEGNVYLEQVGRQPQLYTRLIFTITASPAAGLRILPKEGVEAVIVVGGLP